MTKDTPSRCANPASDDSLAINNTRLRRLLTLLGLKTTGRVYRRQGICHPISRHLIVKSDSFANLTEAATMKYVAENTSIPVPKVWCAFVRDGRTYIVMERIRAHSIAQGWDERSEESKNKLFAQLKVMMEQLRSLRPPPGSGVQSCIGGSLFDSRMARGDRRFGPFKTVQEFHLWLRDGLQPSEMEQPEFAAEEEWQDIKEMAARQDGPCPPPVFTHADLNPSNILVGGDEVVGIIDWEFSGWYPHYWEYTSAWTCQILRTEWQNLLPSFLEPFPDELRMEITRQRHWGEF